MTLFYDLTTFQILGQKLSNFFIGILVQTMTPKGHFEINWPLAKVLDCIKSAEYFLEFATNRSAMLPQIFWKCAFIKASQIIFYKKSPLLFKVKIVKCLISLWEQSWERGLHKHKCCDVCTSACAKPFPKIVPMAKLHSLIVTLIKKNAR